MAWHVEILIAGDQFNGRILLQPHAADRTFTSRTENGDTRTLANTGLTSIEVTRLGTDNSGHLFAATRSIMGEGGGVFRSTSGGDSWTEQNNGFTAFER
jgi:hypothetical protein